MGSSNNKLLASLAVFRNLDKDGKSINVILSEFLMDIIKSKKLYQFTASEIGMNLEEMYDFQIPDAVIRQALKKINFIVMKNHQYTVSDPSQLQDYNLDKQQTVMLDKYNNILQKLFEYIEKKQTIDLSIDEKEKIEKSFTSFVLDNAADNGYSDFISAFIIEHKDNSDFMDTMNLIKEGVILYTGLKFNPHMNLNTSWNSHLTIYLNTEIIFHFVGYNGELYKKLFDDFYNLVKEINREKKYIWLKYFPETKEEIESFFFAAEKIIRGNNSLNATSSAMRMLVNGCKDSIAILAKKAELFQLLKTYGIYEEEKENIYIRENFKYNISEQAISEKYLKEFSGKYDLEYIEEIIKKLSFINIKRGEREKNNFENIGYILLTENSKINVIAWDEEIKNKGDVPLTTNLQFITNKLWFKLNKGFGKSDYPVSFKIITKAQILLASHLSDTLSQDYKELQKRVNNGKMTEETALSILYELKNRSKMPEDLYDSDMSSVLATINEKKLDDYALQHESIMKKAKEEEEKNKKLEEEKVRLQNENKKSLKEKEIENNKLLNQLIEEKEKKYLQIVNAKDDISKKAGRIFKREQFLGLIAYVASLVYIAYNYIDWNNFEKWAWLATLIVPGIVFLLREKIDILQDNIKNRKETILHNLYIKNKFNHDEIEEFFKEIQNLRSKLNK